VREGLPNLAAERHRPVFHKPPVTTAVDNFYLSFRSLRTYRRDKRSRWGIAESTASLEMRSKRVGWCRCRATEQSVYGSLEEAWLLLRGKIYKIYP
jgi:hypothetical protein